MGNIHEYSTQLQYSQPEKRNCFKTTSEHEKSTENQSRKKIPYTHHKHPNTVTDQEDVLNTNHHKTSL